MDLIATFVACILLFLLFIGFILCISSFIFDSINLYLLRKELRNFRSILKDCKGE